MLYDDAVATKTMRSIMITRFAPSPTGFLHIGGARTALFNYLLAKHYGGKMLLRIEDTDLARSTQEYVDAILNSLEWLGIQYDGEPIFQSANQQRHREVALKMLESGHAYRCYCTQEEIAERKQRTQTFKYDRKCRHNTIDLHRAYTIRLKAPETGETVVDDLVQGRVIVQNTELDDMILLRSDGTPTYLLSVVVDDHDMGVTHVVRGDDHLTNTFRQIQIYNAMNWTVPQFAHIPLIHGDDGKKLSKRHCAVGVEHYKAMGLLPDAICNYLMRLGWSHGDDEIISRAQAIEWFDFPSLGKAAATFNTKKLLSINAHYLREASSEEILQSMHQLYDFPSTYDERISKGILGIKQRSQTICEAYELAKIYMDDFYVNDDLQVEIPYKQEMMLALQSLKSWEEHTIEQTVRDLAKKNDIKFGLIAQPLRLTITNRRVSPGVFEVMYALGKEETMRRMEMR